MGSDRVALKCAGLLAVLVFVTGPIRLTAQNEYPELSQARIASIAQMLPEKPAGLGVPCADRAAWGAAAQYFQNSIKVSEGLIAAPLPSWDDQEYLRFSKDGDRKTGEAMLARHTGQLTPLVLAECSEWKGRFVARIAEQLDAISAEKSWTLAAHDPELVNFNQTRLYVDLNAAILGHSVAEALYLMGDKIPPATHDRAMAALEAHVFSPMRRVYAGKEQTYIDWLTEKHNWNSVCLNGLTDAALTILPGKRDRALFVAAAEHWVPNYLDSFSDSGYDSEGIGYWDYGFGSYWELREQLWLSSGGKVDLFDNPKARKAALFGFEFAMLPGVYADFGDAHFGYRPDPAFLAWIDRTFALGVYPDDMAMVRGERFEELASAALAAFPLKSQRHDAGLTAAGLLGVRAWYPEPGILVDRPAEGGGLAITIKTGGNGNHSHNDVGSYSIGMKDTQVVGDPGGPGFYNADTFNSKRYTYRLMNSFGHPVPEIEGKLQLEATSVHPAVVSTKFTDHEDSIAMDITPAYDDPKLKKLMRTMKFTRGKGGSIEIADEFQIAGPVDVVESFPAHGSAKQIDLRTLEFEFQGQRLLLGIDAPGEITFTNDKVEEMGNSFTRAGAEVHLEKSGKIVMRFRPAEH